MLWGESHSYLYTPTSQENHPSGLLILGFCQPPLCRERCSDKFSCWPKLRFLCLRHSKDRRCAGEWGCCSHSTVLLFPGTLTQNEMVFKRLHLGTVAYGLDSMDEVQSHIFSIYTQVQLTASPDSLLPKVFHITGLMMN